MTEFWEVCRDAIRGKVEALADHLGKQPSTVYRWGQARNASGAPMPADMVIETCGFLGDTSIVEYLANAVGLVTFRIPDVCSKKLNCEEAAALCREFGQMLDAMGRANRDDQVNGREFERIEREFYHLITQAKRTLEIYRGRLNGEGRIIGDSKAR